MSYINTEVVTALMQYIKDHPTISFNETIYVMTTMGYTIEVSILWLNSFIHGSYSYGIIVDDTFDSFKEKSNSLDITLGAKVAGVVELYLTENPVYYKIDMIIYNLLTKRTYQLNRLQTEINKLQTRINNYPDEKFEPDTETLEYWNMSHPIEVKEQMKAKLLEKQELLAVLQEL